MLKNSLLEAIKLLNRKAGFVKVHNFPLLKVNTDYNQGKPGVEIRIEPLSGDNSQSRERISNGLNKFVRDLSEKYRIPDEEEIDSARTGQPSSQELRIEPRSQKETDRPSAEAKLEPNSSSIQQPSLEQIPIPEKKRLDIEPTRERYTTLSHDVPKRMITLFRHEQNILREEDGAVEFGRLKRDINAHQRQFSTFCTSVKEHLDKQL